jgi:hypothetical protein
MQSKRQRIRRSLAFQPITGGMGRLLRRAREIATTHALNTPPGVTRPADANPGGARDPARHQRHPSLGDIAAVRRTRFTSPMPNRSITIVFAPKSGTSYASTVPWLSPIWERSRPLSDAARLGPASAEAADGSFAFSLLHGAGLSTEGNPSTSVVRRSMLACRAPSATCADEVEGEGHSSWIDLIAWDRASCRRLIIACSSPECRSSKDSSESISIRVVHQASVSPTGASGRSCCRS